MNYCYLKFYVVINLHEYVKLFVKFYVAYTKQNVKGWLSYKTCDKNNTNNTSLMN